MAEGRNTPISDASDEPTYALTARTSAIGMTLRVTARRVGFDDAITVSNVIGATAGGALQATVQPAITGTPASGTALYVSSGAWTQPQPTLTYQWLRTGAPIPGATNSYYSLTPGGRRQGRLRHGAGLQDGLRGGVGHRSVRLRGEARLDHRLDALGHDHQEGQDRSRSASPSTVPGVAGPSGVIKIQDG